MVRAPRVCLSIRPNTGPAGRPAVGRGQHVWSHQMKHRVAFSALNRSPEHKWAMLRQVLLRRHFSLTLQLSLKCFRNMVTSLIEHERIQTTVPKAKELRILAEKMITLGKRGNSDAWSKANGIIQSEFCTRKVFEDFAVRYAYVACIVGARD
jgi:ribosomal protein L17